MVHRGEKLATYLRVNGVNLTRLATKLPWTTKTIYRHLTKEDLGFEELFEYSKALKYDFKEEFPELEVFRKGAREPFVAYEINDEDDLVEHYRKKYESILEKYTDMLEKYNDLLLRRPGTHDGSKVSQKIRSKNVMG